MDSGVVRWLFDHGGPCIRYRLFREYGHRPPGVKLDTLRNALLKDAVVHKWLDNLQSFEFMDEQRRLGTGLGEGGHSSFMHGAKSMNFEVVLPKLAQLGLHARIPVLDEKVSSWLNFLQSKLEETYGPDYNDDGEFHWKVYSNHDGRMIVATSLAQSGYADEPPVKDFLYRRLDTVYNTVKNGSHDILEPPGKVKIRPAKWASCAMKYELFSTGEIKLPFLHDIFGFATIYGQTDAAARKKIDIIIKWILAPEYQTLPINFGFIRYPCGRGKTVGLRTDLPGYDGFGSGQLDPRSVVLRCRQMAHFAPAREHPWFQAALKHLESFRTPQGTYIFPSDYLEEAGYQGRWAEGYRMGLGENRRNPLWRKIESTFWMQSIKALL
jgi:hypothetical protein